MKRLHIRREPNQTNSSVFLAIFQVKVLLDKDIKTLILLFLGETSMFCGNKVYSSPSGHEKFIKGETSPCEILKCKNQADQKEHQKQTGFLKLLKEKSDKISKKSRIESRFAIFQNLIEYKIKLKEEAIIKGNRELKILVLSSKCIISVMNISKRYMEKKVNSNNLKKHCQWTLSQINLTFKSILKFKTATYESETKNKYDPPIQISSIKLQINQN
ncbi:unnamed protein product [Paramecium sonneborni]|uniref:Uncharacterized protein n=1 Tax=Paramecium sonneborni TaxID=65129 RepID=A0A8S1JX49_9CILI|nr:unnamed protein product [Paramecium sonneborni]